MKNQINCIPIERKLLYDIFNLDKFSAKHGRAGGMLVNKLFDKLRFRKADEPRNSENWLASLSTISNDFDHIF